MKLNQILLVVVFCFIGALLGGDQDNTTIFGLYIIGIILNKIYLKKEGL